VEGNEKKESSKKTNEEVQKSINKKKPKVDLAKVIYVKHNTAKNMDRE
jgi:hypothetical protein